MRSGPPKRRISQGQAIRSIFGRWRVTHTVWPSSLHSGTFAAGIIGNPASRHATQPPSRFSADIPSDLKVAATPSESFQPSPARNRNFAAFQPARDLADLRKGMPDGSRNHVRVVVKVLVDTHIDNHRVPQGFRSVWKAGKWILEFRDGNGASSRKTGFQGRETSAYASRGVRSPHLFLVPKMRIDCQRQRQMLFLTASTAYRIQSWMSSNNSRTIFARISSGSKMNGVEHPAPSKK